MEGFVFRVSQVMAALSEFSFAWVVGELVNEINVNTKEYSDVSSSK